MPEDLPLTTALERSLAPEASARYAAALDLGGEPSAESASRLVALLDDQAEVCVDEGSVFHDVDPTFRPVSAAARESLARMGAFLWPAIGAAWSGATGEARRGMLSALGGQPVDVRARFPDEAHALLEEDARSAGVTARIAAATWERALSARVRAGELAEPEAFWRAVHDHPSPTERDRSVVALASVASDPVALGRELLGQLARRDVWTQNLLSALVRLPPVMPGDLVASMIASSAIRKHPEVWPWLARHGDAARALVPICVAELAPTMLGQYAVTVATLLDERRWRLASEALAAFGPLDPEVRATLLERLATTNETLSLQGSLRRWLFRLLGDDARLAADLSPWLEAMEGSSDPVALERARQLRRHLAG